MKKFFATTCFFAFLLFFQGCGGPPKPDGLPDLYPCSITVTQENQPLAGALITLVPKTGGSLNWAVDGTTNANGVAEIKTAANFKGAPAGDYIVRISKTELSPSAVSETAPSDPVEYDKWVRAKSSEVRIATRMVKEEFDDVKKTPHSITVAQGKNEATFDVGEAIQEEIRPKRTAPVMDSTFD